MIAYYLSWGVSLVVLLLLAGWIGDRTEAGSILIDRRGRYSLTHFQTVVWTIVILSSLIGVFVAGGFSPESLALPPTLLGLMGVSAGSGVVSTATKAGKDQQGSTARVWAHGTLKLADGSMRTGEKAKFSQIWLEEEGDLADKAVSITKYQNFIFTLIILGAYVSLSVSTHGIPDLPANVVYLIGISHAGYVGGKVPNKA